MKKLINKFLKILFFPYDYIKYRLLNFILKNYNPQKGLILYIKQITGNLHLLVQGLGEGQI